MADKDRWRDPWDDYHTDPAFRSLVENMMALILQADYTPSEVRRAAIMACIKAENMRPAPSIMIFAGNSTIAERMKR